jgi:hypothetical protein
MSYEVKTWADRQSEYPGRRKLTKSDGTYEVVTVERDEGNISTRGDAFSAANMNDLEARIERAFTTDEAAISNLTETKQDSLTFDTEPIQDSSNPVTSGGLYIVLGNIQAVLEQILGIQEETANG